MMMRRLYDILFSLFAVGALPSFILKGKLTDGFGQRLGKVSDKTLKALAGKKVIWVHAVSVGEVQAASQFTQRLKRRMPGYAVLLTVTTKTGYAVARGLSEAYDALSFFPIDMGFCIRRFVRRVNPTAMILMETEIWPNLLWELERRGVPVFILNGRISDRAVGAYRRMRFFFKGLLGAVTAFGVQDDLMRERFIEIGAKAQRVFVTGNIKFDWTPAPSAAPTAQAIRLGTGAEGGLLIVAGSTHAGEERQLFEIVKGWDACGMPRASFVVAPRHPERVAGLVEEAEAMGLRPQMITLERILKTKTVVPGPAKLYVLNQMGVLARFYEAADIVFIGGSLVDVGGHNLVEAAYFAKPIIVGPYLQNFKQMADAFNRGLAIIIAANVSDFKMQLFDLARDPYKRKELGQKAQALIETQKGAIENNIELVCRYFEKSCKN